jgi:hypothetical protein
MMRYGRMNVTGRWPPLPDKFTMVACVCELFVVPREQNIFVRDCAPGNKELILASDAARERRQFSGSRRKVKMKSRCRPPHRFNHQTL